MHSLRQDIADNQKLILAVGDMDLLHQIGKMNKQEVASMIDDAYRDVCGESKDPAVAEAYTAALQQAAVA